VGGQLPFSMTLTLLVMCSDSSEVTIIAIKQTFTYQVRTFTYASCQLAYYRMRQTLQFEILVVKID